MKKIIILNQTQSWSEIFWNIVLAHKTLIQSTTSIIFSTNQHVNKFNFIIQSVLLQRLSLNPYQHEDIIVIQKRNTSTDQVDQSFMNINSYFIYTTLKKRTCVYTRLYWDQPVYRSTNFDLKFRSSSELQKDLDHNIQR